jgi:hypothetical protein
MQLTALRDYDSVRRWITTSLASTVMLKNCGRTRFRHVSVCPPRGMPGWYLFGVQTQSASDFTHVWCRPGFVHQNGKKGVRPLLSPRPLDADWGFVKMGF